MLRLRMNSDLLSFSLSLCSPTDVSMPCLSRQCGLPPSEECQALAEAALSQGDLFSAVKFHLLSSEPEAALHIGIEHVKGIDEASGVQWCPSCSPSIQPEMRMVKSVAEHRKAARGYMRMSFHKSKNNYW